MTHGVRPSAGVSNTACPAQKREATREGLPAGGAPGGRSGGIGALLNRRRGAGGRGRRRSAFLAGPPAPPRPAPSAVRRGARYSSPPDWTPGRRPPPPPHVPPCHPSRAAASSPQRAAAPSSHVPTRQALTCRRVPGPLVFFLGRAAVWAGLGRAAIAQPGAPPPPAPCAPAMASLLAAELPSEDEEDSDFDPASEEPAAAPAARARAAAPGGRARAAPGKAEGLLQGQDEHDAGAQERKPTAAVSAAWEALKAARVAKAGTQPPNLTATSTGAGKKRAPDADKVRRSEVGA